MALPKITLPIFEAVLPSTKKKFKYRPMTLKEEKILLIAKESNDPEHLVTAIKQVVNLCLASKLNVETLATFDIEYILVCINSKSNNNVVEFKIRDDETKELVEVEMNLDDLKIHFSDEHTDKIQVTDDCVIIMRYPSMNEVTRITRTFESNDINEIYKIFISCMSKIVAGDDVFEPSSMSEEEISEFFEGLPSGSLKKMKTFFETMPVLRFEYKYTNNIGKEKTWVLQGLDNFFI